jgi:inorganic phosphate transporter, PiT family
LIPDQTWILLTVTVVAGLYMAWNIGANDVANAMGTSVGSGALTVMGAVCVAAVMEFSGAFFAGGHVSETIRSGIVDPLIFEDQPLLFVYGMISAILAAAIWLQIASYFGWPVSTTHSIIGAVVGFGAVYGGVHAVQWGKVVNIAMSWVISPVLAGGIAYLIFRLVLKSIFHRPNPVEAAKRITPLLVFLVFFILMLSLFIKGLQNVNLHLTGPQTLLVSTIVALVAAAVSHQLVRRVQADPRAIASFHQAYLQRGLEKSRMHLRRICNSTTGDAQNQAQHILTQVEQLSTQIHQTSDRELLSREFRQVERIFVYLQILSACFVAFAHGANDVANAIGPMSAAIQTLKSGLVETQAAVPTWALALGGFGIVIGLATWGWRVMETIGKRITELTPTRGFCAEFGAATTIVFASRLGLPISTTHTLVGAVLGVGIARGLGALNLNTVRDIVIAWIVTVPAGAGLAILLFFIIRAIAGT